MDVKTKKKDEVSNVGKQSQLVWMHEYPPSRALIKSYFSHKCLEIFHIIQVLRISIDQVKESELEKAAPNNS